MVMKEMDVFDLVKHSFDWAKEPELKSLFGAFFAGNLFPMLLLGLLFCTLALVATFVLFDDTLRMLILNDIILVILGAAITLIITGALTYYILSRFGWTKDKEFMSLAWKLSKIRFVLYVITLVLVLLVLCVILGIFKQELLGEELGNLVSILPDISLLFGAPILVILFGLVCITESFWMYINSFFLTGKMLELRGKCNEFTQISIDNYIKYLKFEFVKFFTVCLNWMNSKILAAQAILLALTIIMLILAVTSNIGMLKIVEAIIFLLLAIAFGMLYFILAAYCGMRLYVATPVRILESKSSKNSMKITWEKMGGHTLNAFFTFILLMLAIFAVWFVSFILETLSQLPMQIGVFFTPLLIIALPFYVLVVIMLRSMMGNVALFTTLLTTLNFYGKLNETGKKNVKPNAKEQKPKAKSKGK
jgi:hypothetical protein